MSSFPLYDQLRAFSSDPLSEEERVYELRKLSSLQKVNADAVVAMVMKYIAEEMETATKQEKELYKKRGRGKKFPTVALHIGNFPEPLQVLVANFIRALEGRISI